MGDEVPLHGVPVHVMKFLNKLGLTPEVEIVEARLPELWQRIMGMAKGKSELLGGHFFAWLVAEPPRHALFQDLQDC